jgi:hypothetical protein
MEQKQPTTCTTPSSTPLRATSTRIPNMTHPGSPHADWFLDQVCKVFADSRIGGVEKLVLIAYQLYGDQSSDETIMAMCTISEPDLYAAQMELKRLGLLQGERNYESESHCEYCLMKQCICQEPDEAKPYSEVQAMYQEHTNRQPGKKSK